MTCREKLKIEHPELVDDAYCGGCRDCPHSDKYKYLSQEKCLCCKRGVHPSPELCTKCWDQEVEEPATNTTAATETLDYSPYAKHLRMKYEALIAAGFNPDQAIQLISGAIQLISLWTSN